MPTWTQAYAPVMGSVSLSALVAAIPVVFLQAYVFPWSIPVIEAAAT